MYEITPRPAKAYGHGNTGFRPNRSAILPLDKLLDESLLNFGALTLASVGLFTSRRSSPVSSRYIYLRICCFCASCVIWHLNADHSFTRSANASVTQAPPYSLVSHHAHPSSSRHEVFSHPFNAHWNVHGPPASASGDASEQSDAVSPRTLMALPLPSLLPPTPRSDCEATVGVVQRQVLVRKNQSNTSNPIIVARILRLDVQGQEVPVLQAKGLDYRIYIR